MRNRTTRGRRRVALAAAGLLAAGALSGCQGGHAPFLYTGVARGDVLTAGPTSPAFAKVAAGQQLAVDPHFVPGTPTVVIPSCPATPPADGHPAVVTPGTPLSSARGGAGHPVVGSGGLVYPVAYSSGSGQPATAPTPSAVMPPAPAVMPFQAIPAMPPGSAGNPGMAGQQMILLVNGPSGPQYVIAEVLGAAPAPVATMGTPIPPPAAPVVPAGTSVPASGPSLMPTAAAFAAGPAAEPLPAPTFNPPPPPAIPMPAMPSAPAPAVVPVDMGTKAPDPLPPAVGAKGPTLPPPGAGASPESAPAVKAAPAPKLSMEIKGPAEEIPAAPVFMPVGK